MVCGADACSPLVHMAMATVVLSIQLSSSQCSTVTPYRPALPLGSLFRFEEEGDAEMGKAGKIVTGHSS